MLVISLALFVGCDDEEPKSNPKPQETTGLLKGVSVSPKSFDGDDFVEFLDKVRNPGCFIMGRGLD